MYGNEDNQRQLAEARRVQEQTRDRLRGIERTLAATEESAAETTQKLARQTQQLHAVHEEVGVVGDKLDTAQRLQNKFDRWAWKNTNTRDVEEETRHAVREQAAGRAAQAVKVTTVYENQRWDPVRRVWKEPFLAGDACAWMDAERHMDASGQVVVGGASPWSIDFSAPNADPEGFVYSTSFANLSRNLGGAKNWRSSVRRRVWRREASTGAGADVEDVKAKYRGGGGGHTVGATHHATPVRIGAPVGQINFQQTGTATGAGSGAGGLTGQEQGELRQIDDADREIDAAVDRIGDMVGRLGRQANAIGEEVRGHNATLQQIDVQLDENEYKLTKVNARARRQAR